jgi:fatty acid desaturase
MHHPENNLDDDLSSTMHLQRDSAWDFFIHYLGHFLVLGGHDLSGYLRDRNRDKILRRWRIGTALWFVVVIGLALVNWQATLLVFGFTLLVTRTAMMSGNWAQHAFVDATQPDNCYVNSITCINSTYNKRCFNDGYHISHHWKPARHWTEHPQELKDNLAEYADADAVIFRKLDYFAIWVFLMLKRYDKLADHYVAIDDRQRNKEEIIELLKERTRRIAQPELVAAGAI